MAKRKAAPKEDAAQDDAPSTAPKDSVYIGKSIKPEFFYLRLANRHGLITGATGTGKTVTLQGLAEGFSDQGVPVFCADVKGDLSGVAEQGEPKPWIEGRHKEIGYQQDYKAYPVIFWDLFGEKGHPIRATVSELGPLLLSRLMDLSEAKKACSISPSKSPTTKSCRCSISRTCNRCCKTWLIAPVSSPRNTGISPRPRSGRSSARCWCSSSKAPIISSASLRSKSAI